MRLSQCLRNKKSPIVVLAALAFLLSVNTVCAKTLNPTKEKPLILKFNTYAADTTIIGKELAWWGQQLEKRTDGRVKIQFYWAQSLVKVGESIDAVARNIAHMSFIPVAYFHGKLPLSSTTELIYFTDKPDVQAMACTELYKTYKPFREEWERRGMHVTHFHNSYSSVLINKKKVETLENLQGLRIRGLGLISEAIKLLGAVPLSLPGTEIYSAMERGVIDGVCGAAFDWTISMRMPEVGPYITDPGVGIYITLASVINNKLWKQLPDDIKAVIDDLGKDFPVKTLGIAMEKNKLSVKSAIEQGAELYLLSDQEKKRWKEKVTPALWNNWQKTMEKNKVNVSECLTKYREILSKYEGTSKFVSPFEQYKQMKASGEIK